MNLYCNSFRIWLLPILFCVLCENLRAQEWLTVEDGNTSSPYYTFETIQQVPIDISTYGFQRGQSYAFLPQGVSTNHPFMIGEHNGDLNSSLLSVVGGGTVTPLTYNTSNLMITIPSNYSGNLVYFSTTDTSVHYYLSIVDPPGGNYQSSGGGYQSGGGGYQSPGSSYQPVYDLNASHLTNLSVQVNQSLAGKYSFFNRTNSSGSPEIRLELMEVATGQWQPQGIASSLYYLAKPDLFPSIPHIYDYLTSINLSPVNGYKPPGVNYQSSGSGYSSPPIYETTATLIVNNQPTSITGIPRAATGSTWYQSFTAENSAKLTKFAFATNGSFSATADVTIREGEGVAGNILHSGTWTGLGSNTNSFNEYEITNEVLLTSGQKYTIQLENQTAGGFIGSNPGQYNGGMFYYSGYSGEYGDLKMKIWGQLEATGNAIDIISPATNDQNITDDNHTLTISYNYQSDSGGYQTPTWAYRIDSGFPSYGSPHGGTQVTGSRTKNNFLSGQTYGSKTVYVALLDQNGNLHNPPITLNRTLNYQSSGGGYSSPGSGYSSPGNGYSSPGSGYSSAGSGYSSPPIYETTATLIVNNQPTSITGIPRAATGSTWYQSFTAENSAKLTKFAFATNGSFSATADVTIREGEGVAGNILHSGTWTGLGSNTNSFNEYEITNEVLLTSGQKYTIQLENQTAGGFIGSNPGQYNGGMFYYSGYSGEYGDLKMKIWGQLEATGNAIDIISPATNDQNITDDNHTLTISYNYQSDSGGYQTPTWAYRIDSGFPSYGSPHGGTQVTGSRTKNNFLSGQTYGSKTVYVALLDQNGNLHNPPITLNRTLNYQSSGGGYSSPGSGYSSPGNGYSSPGSGYSSAGSGYSSPPIYETTATLIVNNQPTSITGIPRAATGSTWYQSFTAENSAKLTKFAFATNGSFSATADVTIREGEGVAGNILHSGTWTGLGSNTNSFNEYEITNEVLLTSGQKYTIQLENQTAGGFIGSNPGQYNGGMFYYSGYSGEYGDLKMKIWGQLEATGNAIDIISPATNDQNITDDNHTLTISYNYQSDSGGYQTPTWAYRIDSGFPSYGSPHGGTQVTGSRTKNNFLSGQTYGSKTVYVALLDQNGNLHNPPITLNRTLNYQSSGGGYSSPGSGYSSPGNGYSSPGSGYSSAGSGYSSPPIYETTATLIVNNQPTSITGIPRAATGSTWYQSFTAENSAKLTKFAFATNGSFSATADVTIREGEGVAGNILHSGTWTGLGSNTNSFNEYEITNEVLLTSGQKYTIQLENQTAGGFIGSNPGQYNGGMFYYSGYSGEYGDLKMKIWGQLEATGNAIDIISPATNDQNITDDNHTLTISYNYQSDSGGYQTPTWAYRIDSGFPSYGSPHGGTQVTGSRTKNNFLSGQTYGSKTVYVALLDQNGNLHNPPITLNRTLNYQSSGGGYSSPGGGYSSPGSGYSSPNSGYTSPSDGYNSPDSGYSTPANGYSSPGDGYSSPNSGYTSPSDGYNSPDSGYSTPANGYSSPGDGYSSPNSGYTSPSDGYNSPDSGYSTPANGYSSPGEGYSSPNSGYTSPSDGYNSPDSGYSTPANGYSSPGDGYSSPNSGYTSPSDGYNSPDSGYSTPANGYNSPGDGYSSPNSGYTSPSDGYNSPDSGYSTPANGYSSPGEGYSSPDSGYSSPSDGYESIPALLAFVNTVGHESDQDGIILSGEILRESDTNNDNIMVGFLLSTNIDLLLNDPFTQKVIGEFKNEGLFTGNFNSTLDGVIYYKAFAENEMGVSYGKVNKIAVIKSTNSQGQSPTEKAISTLGEDSIELPGGWNDNSWFGLYKVYENGWIYHSAHGWLYLSADSSDGIWAWSEKRSWVWSSKEIYPFLYQPSIGNWIYFLTSKNGQVYFFNYSTNLVEVNIP